VKSTEKDLFGWPRLSGMSFSLVMGLLLVSSIRGHALEGVPPVVPRLGPRGFLLAHNVVNKQTEMRDFLDAIHTDARLLTSIVKPGNEGMSVSVKIR